MKLPVAVVGLLFIGLVDRFLNNVAIQPVVVYAVRYTTAGGRLQCPSSANGLSWSPVLRRLGF